MGIRLMELKTNGTHKEFILKESVTERILTWECLPDIGSVKRFLITHKFPQDRCYSEEDFLSDVRGAEGYIHLWVEKEDTAEFICQLCSELI